MNFYELIVNLCYPTGVGEAPPASFDDTDEEPIQYKQYINQALNEVFSEEWNFRKDLVTFQTVAGQSSYDMPAGIIEKAGVRVEGVSYPLTNQKQPYYLEEKSGLPCSYYVQGSKLVLYPTPTDIRTVTVHFLNLMNALSADNTPKVGLTLETDKPNIPEVFHDVIVRKAELIYMRDKANKNNAQARLDAQKRINQLTDLDRGTLDASPIITF